MNIEQAFEVRKSLLEDSPRNLSVRMVLGNILRGEYDRVQDAIDTAKEDLEFLTDGRITDENLKRSNLK